MSEVDHFHHPIDCYFQFPDLLENHCRSTAPVYFSMKLETPRSFCIDTHSSRPDSRPINGFRYRLASAQEKIALGSLHIQYLFPLGPLDVDVSLCFCECVGDILSSFVIDGIAYSQSEVIFSLSQGTHDTIIDSLSLSTMTSKCLPPTHRIL